MSHLDDELKNEILAKISLEGASSDENKTINVIIASRSQNSALLQLHTGLPKLKPHMASQFRFILSQPHALTALSALQIRCCLCGKIISYPAWHMSQRFAVNWFHYFICFDKDSPTKPTAKCYRRI